MMIPSYANGHFDIMTAMPAKDNKGFLILNLLCAYFIACDSTTMMPAGKAQKAGKMPTEN
jgi:hypothetical protein